MALLALTATVEMAAAVASDTRLSKLVSLQGMAVPAVLVAQLRALAMLGSVVMVEWGAMVAMALMAVPEARGALVARLWTGLPGSAGLAATAATAAMASTVMRPIQLVAMVALAATRVRRARVVLA